MFRKCFGKKEPQMKPGAILDQVISESSATANKCLLYTLADYKRGGNLIDAINTGGLVAVEQLIRDEFGVFMYNSGRAQEINRAEFLRWKYRDHKEVTIPIEDSLSIHDPLGKWQDHRACWKMQYRGALGESLLHVLIICDSKIHTKLARVLLRVFPNLALDVMEGEEYLGASALHLAIAYSNNELVADLIEAGADIHQRAIGSFFLPWDQQRSRPAKSTDYEGLAYMGEYPLAWAACCTNESVYNLLLDHGADPDAQDSFGNMILHMVVVCDKLDMFGYALRHPKTPAKNGIANNSGLTPLTLACKLGRAEVFREMLELSSREFWRYSNITCSGYPLNALDTLLPDGRTNWNSALFIILNGTKEAHLDMLDGGIIQRLLEEKWKTFARNEFLKRLLTLFIHLFFLSISVYLRPVRNEPENSSDAEDTKGGEKEDKKTDVQQIIRYCSEVATIAGVLSYVILQQGDEVKNQGLSAFLKQLGHAPAKAIFLFSNLLILACIPFRFMGDADTEEAILAFAVPGSWFLLMFFAGAVRLTGPFVTMIYSMLTGDMFTFGIIYSIVLFGFSQAFFFLYKGHPQLQGTMFNTYPSTWMALFQTTLGDYNYPDLNQTSYPNLAKTVFVMFMIFVPILLLNMLIAMMGNTYAHVIEQSEKEWMKQWAKIVVTLERAVPQADAQKYLEAYSIPLGPSDDSGFEQRGVMVIKSKNKTRAKQRKGAVSNWKRVGKVTLDALKKRGMTGEEMRRLMWGRASISSPIKIAKKKLKDPYNLNPQPGFGNALNIMNIGQDTLNVKLNGTHHSVDPLRDLVLHAELSDTKDPEYQSCLKKLAFQARSLVESTISVSSGKVEQKTEAIPTPKPLPPKPQVGEEENPELIQNLFNDPKYAVDPKKVEDFYKMLDEIETDESDCSFMGLGYMSLMEKIKKSMTKIDFTKFPIPGDEDYFSCLREELNAVKKNEELHDNKDEMESERDNEARGESEGTSSESYHSRQSEDRDVTSPIEEVTSFLKQFTDTEQEDPNDEIVTASDVHRAMAQLHLKHRQVVPDEASRRAKSARVRRKRRVHPSDSFETNSGRYRSAPMKKNGFRDSLQDPLEPWSTRELQDINKILGYK